MNDVTTRGIEIKKGELREKCNTRMIRYQSMIMCVYFFLQLLRVFATNNFVTFLTSLTFFVCFGVLTYMSYRIAASRLIKIYSLQLIIFVILNYIFWGSDGGGQYFLFVMMTSVLVISSMRVAYKAVIALVISVAYGILYFASHNMPALFPRGDVETLIFRIIDCITIFALTFACLLILLDYLGDLEEKLNVANGKLIRFGKEDPHTGLLNRRYMMEYLSSLKKENNKQISIAVGDVDFFAKINSQNGYDCGDLILKQLAYQFLSAMDGKGRVARWGGEEFLFVFEDVSCEDAYYYLTKIQQQIRNMEIAWNDDKIKLSMTFGLMECDPEMSLDYCLTEAGKKLEMGKVSGRNTIIY